MQNIKYYRVEIGQYLTKLCVEYGGLTFLAHPVYASTLKALYQAYFCSRSTSFLSVLEVFHDYVLHKFTMDIDNDIEYFSLP